MRSDKKKILERQAYIEWARKQSRVEQISTGMDGEGPKGTVDVYVDREKLQELIDKGVRDGYLG